MPFSQHTQGGVALLGKHTAALASVALPLRLLLGLPHLTCAAVPPRARTLKPGQLWASATCLLSRQSLAAQDGLIRWSAGPLYSMHTLRLVTHFYIRERQQDINPHDAISHNDWQLPPSRPR